MRNNGLCILQKQHQRNSRPALESGPPVCVCVCRAAVRGSEESCWNVTQLLKSDCQTFEHRTVAFFPPPPRALDTQAHTQKVASLSAEHWLSGHMLIIQPWESAVKTLRLVWHAQHGQYENLLNPQLYILFISLKRRHWLFPRKHLSFLRPSCISLLFAMCCVDKAHVYDPISSELSFESYFLSASQLNCPQEGTVPPSSWRSLWVSWERISARWKV